MVTVFMTGVSILLIFLLKVYLENYRGLAQTDFRPRVIWLRALIVFCSFSILAWHAGTIDTLLANPFVTSAQLQSTAWIIYTAFCFVFVFIAYWIVWAGMTLQFNRKRYWAVQIGFGLVWGTCTSLVFLTIWNVCRSFDWPVWGQWIAGYALLSAFMGLWQDLYWDVWVVPEHDTPRSLKLKVIYSHVPNMTICLTYLAIYDNQWIFIILQTMALTGASIFLRWPPWWEKEDVVAPRTEPGLFGLPHAAGYIGENK